MDRGTTDVQPHVEPPAHGVALRTTTSLLSKLVLSTLVLPMSLMIRPVCECTFCGVTRKFVWMGGYGGSSPKPTILMSNSAWIDELYSPSRPRESMAQATNKYHAADGRLRVTGTKFLKGTLPGAYCVVGLTLAQHVVATMR